MKRISLYPNPDRDPSLLRTSKVLAALGSFSGEILLDEKYEGTKEISSYLEKITFVSEEELFSLGDVMITLGGDGTILSVAARAAAANLPLFGINFGKVGFMTALEEGEIHRITELLEGKAVSSSRMMLSCTVGEKSLVALNEIVIASPKGSHMAELCLTIGEKKFCDFRADGLIFNTPTGSTGYTFSAGGAVIDDSLDLIGVKAISSYLLINAHHMIFSGDTKFSVTNSRMEGAPLVLCADGREEITLPIGGRLTVEKSPLCLTLLSLDKKNNMEVFFRKF